MSEASGPAPIRSSRLELVSMSPDFLDALFAGRRAEASEIIQADVPSDWPDEHDARFLRLRVEQMQREPDVQEWLVRAVVLSQPDRAMVGHAGFHGPPGTNGPGKTDAVEVGYTIFPAYRGQGFATEAVGALMEWASAERGVARFVASIGPANEPSLAVVRKLGFVQTGDQWDDEDGLELVFERTVD